MMAATTAPPQECGNCGQNAPTVEHGGVWSCSLCHWPRTEMAVEQPQSFDGVLGIEWPAATGRPVNGWACAPFNADGPVNTIMEFTLHARADDLVWAEATMFADAAGKPVFRSTPPDYQLLVEDGKPVTGTFRFLVTEMRVAGQQEEINRLRRALNDPEFREQEALKHARRNAPGPINKP
jgi:hypothetical protein